MQERKPYPFFYSVEFLTILVKTSATLAIAYPVMAAAGLLTIPSALLFVGAIAQGVLDAKNELEKHPNLYSDLPVIRGKQEAIANIQDIAAIEMAANTDLTAREIKLSTPLDELVDLAVKPSLGNAASKLATKLLRGLF